MLKWWQWLIAISVGGVSIFTFWDSLTKRIGRMFLNTRRGNRMIDAVLGDATASPPIPSMLDVLREQQKETARLARLIEDQPDVIERAVARGIAEHENRWHIPGNGSPNRQQPQRKRR